jgi:hypothetical protein
MPRASTAPTKTSRRFSVTSTDGSIRLVANEAPAIGADTAAACWLCDRERGELCHVHAPNSHDDGEPVAVVVSLLEADEAAP